MKYFFKWLLNDIKTTWRENEYKRKEWLTFLSNAAKLMVRVFSVFLMFAAIMSYIIITTTGNGHFNWLHAVYIAAGLLLLNGTIFFSEKLTKYRKEQARLVKILKD
jgi:hypothetical protein